MRKNHYIKSQIFDTSFNGNQQASHELYLKIKSIFHDELMHDINDCLSRYDRPGYQLSIDKIELDLGEILYDEVDSNFSTRIISELDVAMKRIIYLKSDNLTVKELSVQRQFQIVDYLENGFLKWGERLHFKDALEECVRGKNIDAIISLIKRNGVAKRRFLEKLNHAQFLEIIAMLKPDDKQFIIDLYEEVRTSKLTELLVIKSDSDHSKLIRDFILTYLIYNKETAFNTKEFSKVLLLNLAAHYNQSYIDILRLLVQVVNNNKEERLSVLAEILLNISNDLGVKNDVLITGFNSGNIDKVQNEMVISLLTHISNKSESYSEEEVIKLIDSQNSLFIKEVMRIPDLEQFFDKLISIYSRRVIEKIINAFEPQDSVYILDYHKKLSHVQKNEQLVKGSSKEFEETIWRITLNTLAHNRGSRFNQKSFLVHLLNQVSSHYNVSFEFLLKGIKAAIKHLKKQVSNVGHFVSLLDEVYDENIISVNQLENNRLLDSTNKIKVNDKIDIFKILKDNNLYKSTSSLKIQHLFKHFTDNENNSSGWNKLIGLLKNIADKRKFVTAITEPQFHLLLNNISNSNDMLDVHISLSNVIKKLFSPSFHQYIVYLEISLLELLWTARSDSKNTDFIVVNLVEKLIVHLPVEKNVLLKELQNEFVKKHLTSDVIKRTLSKDSPSVKRIKANFINNIIQKIDSKEKDFSDFGYVEIVKFIDHLVKYNSLAIIKLFSQLSSESTKWLIDQIPPSFMKSIISILQRNSGYDFVKLLNQVEQKIIKADLKNASVLIGKIEKVIIMQIRKNGVFNLSVFIKKFYGLIKNSQAEFLFEIPQFALPVKGSIGPSLTKLEERFSEKNFHKNSKEDHGLEKLERLILLNKKEATPEPLEELFLSNAGFVLLHPYLSHLFDRGGFFTEGKFTNESKQKEAVLYLYYVMTDSLIFQEEDLIICKILCGISVHESIEVAFELSDDLEELTGSLLDAFIGHWEKISSSSHDGLRGGWFFREGKLEVKEDKYELTVEQKAYDILMDYLPFTLSPVKYSWMEKSITVNWR